ncbi:MAG TPA: response regulator [Candidatus Paceibacterota bacterium]
MPSTMKGKKILVVEDELPLRSALFDILTYEGFDVLQAEDGKEGLVLAGRYHPDLILLDIVMPVMDGLTMLKKLRSTDSYGAHVPVVILSNLSLYKEDIHKDVSATEPAFYLVKTDWTLPDVVKKVKLVLSRPPAEPAKTPQVGEG